MNTERLLISQIHQPAPQHALPAQVWEIRYKAWSENPLPWDEIDGETNGQSEVYVDTVLCECPDVTRALAWARSWGVGSGFKTGQPKPAGGNTFEIRLRRP